MIRYLRNGLVAVAIFPFAALAQLPYEYTAFVHGFNDNAARFTTPNTAELLSARVNLKTPEFPDPDGIQAINVQADQLFSALLAQPSGGHVVVGHSMGGLTARSAYFRHSDPATFAAIISLATPHQGAPIADNALLVAGYAADQVTDFFQALINVANRPTPGNILSQAAVGIIQNLVREVFTNNLMAFIVQIFGLKSAGLTDVKTTSPTVASLNSMTDPLPHANVIAKLGRRNAVFRVAASALYKDGSYDSWIHAKNTVKSIVKACRQIGWNFIIRTHVGQVCNQVDNAIGSIDDRWAFFTMGNAEKRDPNATFDGLVPTSHSRYPGTSLSDPTVNFAALNSDHMNIQYDPTAIGQIAQAMLGIGMLAPQPPATVQSVNISGPSSVRPHCTYSWSASPYGGVPPYHYVWTARGTSYDTGSTGELDYAPVSTGSLTISVTVTDSQGSTGTTSKSVSVTSGTCIQ